MAISLAVLCSIRIAESVVVRMMRRSDCHHYEAHDHDKVIKTQPATVSLVVCPHDSPSASLSNRTIHPLRLRVRPLFVSMKAISLFLSLLLSPAVVNGFVVSPHGVRTVGVSQSLHMVQMPKFGRDNENVSVLDKPNDSEIATIDEECVVEEELSETQKLMKQVKEAGTAGIISYALWELGFWAVSVPVVIAGYQAATGHLPDFSNKDDMAKLGAEAFAFVNFARFAVPLRIGLALSTTPWVNDNVVEKIPFLKNKDNNNCEVPNGEA